jgi:glycosyltransferase involved in cell wall biosynthesis
MSKDYLLTIIIPIYNAKEYLSQCIESVINQTYENLEIILVDDGSTDGSGKVCDMYQTNDNRVVVIHKSNGGVSDARNEGLKIANGQLITFVDADDWVDSYTYSVAIENMIKTNADILIFGYNLVKNNKVFKETKNNFMNNNCVLNSADALSLLLLDDKINNFMWNKIFKRHLLKNIHFPCGKICEELYVMSDVFLSANIISIIGNSYNYYYRQRNDSLTKSKLKYYISNHLDALFYCYYKLASNQKINHEALIFGILNKYIDIYRQHPFLIDDCYKIKFKQLLSENNENIKLYKLNRMCRLYLKTPFPIFLMLYNKVTRFVFRIIFSNKDLS